MLAVELVECVELVVIAGESLVEVPVEVVSREMGWCVDVVSEAKAVVAVETGL